MIISIVRKEIQVLLKEKGTFFWLILMPILFILVFCSIFSNAKETTAVAIFDADGSQTSRQLIETIGSMKGFELVDRSDGSLEEQIQQIKEGKATSLVVVPKGFESALQSGKQAQLEFYRDAAADTVVGPVLAVLQNVTSVFRDYKIEAVLKANGKSDAEAKAALDPPVKISDIKENAAKVTAVTQYVPGYTVMFVFFIIITMVRNFIKDRDSGMLARLGSTPMKPYQYLIGMWIPNVIAVIIQSAALLTFGKLAYGVHLGDIVSIILIVLFLAICATGMGLALCLFVKSENQGISYTQLITMGGAILAGIWFPFELMPDFAQKIGKFTPQYWAQHGFQNVMIRGAGLGDIWPTLLVLAAYGAAGLLIAALRYKTYIKTATD